jgi:chemotaxis protein CheD
MTNTVNVGLGEYAISKNPEDVLVSFGLGSCVGISLYDPIHKVAGMLHAVLPENNGSDKTSTKFVNSGVPILVELMVKAGASRNHLILRMAGGSNMLTATPLGKTFDIGTRNVSAAREIFKQMNMRIQGEDVGGNIGRTVRLYAENGRMTVRKIGEQEKEL